MSHDSPTQSQSTITVVAVLIVLLALMSTASVGVVAGQVSNGTNASESGQNASSKSQLGALKPKQGSFPEPPNGRNNTPNGTDTPNMPNGRNKTDGLLDINTTWGEFVDKNSGKKDVSKGYEGWINKVAQMSPKKAEKAFKKNPKMLKKTVDVANFYFAFLNLPREYAKHPKKYIYKHPQKVAGKISHLLSLFGDGGDGGGGIISWTWDTIASIGDTLALGFDEGVGKTVSAFFHGARAFFSWIFGFFIGQGVQIINQTIDAAVKAMTMTPHPTNAGNFYQNPKNGIWSSIWDVWVETGQPVARLIWLASLLFLMAFGNQIGIGTMEYAQEKQAWIGLIISVFFITDAGWTLTQLIPAVVDAVTQSFVADITTTAVLANAAKAVVIIFALILIYFEAFFVLLLMLVAAFRIEVIIAFAPFIPALVVGRFSPFETFSSLSRAGLQLWFVLLVSALPSVLLLNASFVMAQSVIQGGIGALSALMAIPLIAGGLLASALVPFLLWKGTNRVLGSGVSGGIPGVSNGGSFRDKMQEYRGKADRPNRFQRGFRRKDAKTDDRTKSHRAGRGIRNDARNAERKLDNAGRAAEDRAKAMKSWLDRNTP